MTRTVNVGSMAPGVNNRLEPTQLATVLPDRSKATYLYSAANANLNDKGYLRRRRGFSTALPGNAHSLWSDEQGAFAVLNDELRMLTPSGTGIASALVRSAMPQLPVSYSRGADGDVYWSNGADIRRVSGGADRPIAQVALPVTPIVTVAAGVMPAARYLIAFTSVGADGEGPATVVQQVQLTEPGGLAFSVAADVATYLSAPDGDILSFQGLGLPGVVQFIPGGRRCPTLNTSVMPAGSIVRHHNGSMLVAKDNVLHLSQPYNYGITNPSKGYIPFPSTITIVEPTANGVYICADKTYWIVDLLGAGDLQVVLPCGGIPGTGGRSTRDETVFWQSLRGLIVADNSMNVRNVQQAALEISNAASGASYLREENGTTHIVASRANVQPNVAAAATWIEAEIVRKETIV